MSIRRIVIYSVLTLTALGAAAVIYVRSIDFDRYRPALVGELRAATGREVVIDGPIGLSLFPRPRFFASDVVIANAPWGTRDALARIDRVEADLALPPLFRGEAKVRRVRLVNPDIWFETDAVGKINWILAGSAASARREDGHPASGAFLPSLDLRRFDISGGRLTYRDGATGDITLLSVTSASIAGDGYTAPLKLAFSGTWDALPFAMQGVVGPFDAVVSDAGLASAVNLRFEAGDGRASVDGTVGDPRSGPGADLRVSAETTEFGRLARRFGIALPMADAISLDAEVRYRRARLEVGNATLNIGGQALSGKLSVDLSKARPVFAADLHAADIDLTGLAPRPGPAPAVPAGLGGELGTVDTLLAHGVLAMASGTAEIRTETLRLGATTLRDVEARLVVSDAGLVVRPIRARAVGGALEGAIRLDTTASPPRVSMFVKAPAFSAGPLLQRFGTVKAFGGVASIAANLTTVVGPRDAMLAGLEGDALIAMGQGRLTLEPYEMPFEDRVTGLGSLAGLLAAEGHQDVAIECVAGRMTIDGAVARDDGLVLQSADARVKGEGTLNLATGALALRFTPEARNGKLLIARPVSLSGSLAAPELKLESGTQRGFTLSDTALYPFRRFFAGVATNPAANACLRALPPVPPKRRRTDGPIAQRPAVPAPAESVATPFWQGQGSSGNNPPE